MARPGRQNKANKAAPRPSATTTTTTTTVAAIAVVERAQTFIGLILAEYDAIGKR